MTMEEFRLIEEMFAKRDKQYADIILYLNYLADHLDKALTYIKEKDPEWLCRNIPDEIRMQRISNNGLDPGNRIDF